MAIFFQELLKKDIIAEPIKLHNPKITNNDLDNYINDLLESVELSKKSSTRYSHEFSGGQRQRLAIARAVIKRPKILILDDSLSAVDTDTEEEILKHLKTATKNKTTIIVSHRISSVKHADLIIVFENGQIVQKGGHIDLINVKGYYKELSKKQHSDIQE